MAGLIDRIPLPQNGMDAFLTGMQQSQAMFDSMMKNKMRPYQIKLLEAQAAEAEAKAKGEGIAGEYFQRLTGNKPNQNEPLTGTQTPGTFDESGNQTTYNTASVGAEETPQQIPQDQQNVAPEEQNVGTALGLTPREQRLQASANSVPDTVGTGAQQMPSQTAQQPTEANIPNAQQANISTLGKEKIIDRGDPSQYALDDAARRGEEITFHGATIKPKIETSPEKDGYVIKKYPSRLKTIEKVGETPQEQAITKAKGEAAAQTLKDVATTAASSENISASIEGLKDLMKNPRYKNIAGTAEGLALNAKPLGIPLGTLLSNALPKQFPKEDLDLLGQANAYMGNINIAASQLFKGPYKNMIDSLIGRMKPNASDPESVQNGKIRGLETILKLGQKRKALVEKYVGQGMASGMANLRADKEIPFSQIKKEVTDAVQSETIDGYEYKMINGQLHKRKVKS